MAVVGLAVGLARMAAADDPPAAPANPTNPALDELLKTGVPFNGQNARTMRQPTLPDGLDAAAQKKAIEDVLALKSGQQVDFATFTDEERNLNAPYVMRIDVDGENGSGHTIDLWFVVYGKLSTVADPQFLKAQFNPVKPATMTVLQPDDLKQRQIVPRDIPGGKEYFANSTFMIFPADARVKISATARVVQTTTAESTLLAGQIDRRFDNDKAFPNQWWPVRQSGGDSGEPQLGNSNAYTSTGGYVKITKLADLGLAMLVEYHLLYDEPTSAWFNGNNLLRPKIIAETEGDVRTVRRNVRKPRKPAIPAAPQPAAK